MTNRKYTILQILPALNSGGTERGTIDIAKAIVNAGHHALVISEGGRMVEELRQVGGEHITMPVATKNIWHIWRNIKKLETIIRKYNVDIVHARSRAPAWSAFHAAKRCNTPFITTYHGQYRSGNPAKRWYNSVMARSDYVIAVSEFIRDHINQEYPWCQNIHVIERGINPAIYAPANVSRLRIESLLRSWSIEDNPASIILLPGRLTRLKGHTLLIEAIRILSQKRQDFFCICPGDAHANRQRYREELFAQVKHHNLWPYIRFPGHCRDMATAYLISDIVVVPSLQPESFGRVSVEAQMMGRIVVAADHGGSKETINHAQTGFLFQPGDAQALADQLSAALDLSTQQKQNICLQAQKSAHNYTINHMCNKTLDLYKHAIENADTQPIETS